MTEKKARFSKTRLLRATVSVFFGLCFSSFLALASPEEKPIKAVKFIGSRYTKEYILERELSSVIGQKYTEEYIHFARGRLDKLGIFSGIKITPIEEEDGIILQIELKETFPVFPFPNLAISDENGLQYGGSLTALNLKGEALFFSLTALFGGATSIESRIINPWILGDNVAYQLDFYYRNRRNKIFDYQERAFEFYSTFSRPLRNHLNVGARLSLQFLKSDIPGKTLSSDNTDMVPNFAIFYQHDSRDVWSSTRRGWWNEVELLKSGFLVGDSRFWRLTFDIRRYQPIASRQTLALFSLLTFTTGALGKDVALWQQYSIGGANSLRGWPLGADSGKSQFLNTVEYRFHLLEPRGFRVFGSSFYLGIQLAAFADLDCVWNDRNELRPRNFLGGTGIGLRLITPLVGVTRIDFAWGKPGFGVSVCFGAYEKSIKQRERVR